MFDLRIGNRVGNKNKKGNISIFSFFFFFFSINTYIGI